MVFFLSTKVLAQDCSNNIWFLNNSKIEMTTYDKKGELTALINYKISNVNANESNVKVEIQNKKGKLLSGAKGNIKCDGASFSMEMELMLPSDLMKGMDAKDIQVKSNKAYMTYPNSMKIGDILPDNQFTSEVFMGEMKLMTTNFNIKNRRVLSKEKTTTPAGTFDCFTITSSQAMKAGFMNMNFDVIEWYSIGYGVIKSETSKAGKPESSTMMTKIEKQ